MQCKLRCYRLLEPIPRVSPDRSTVELRIYLGYVLIPLNSLKRHRDTIKPDCLDNLRFRTSANAPDSRTYVSVSWNSSAYPARPVLGSGLISFPTSRAQYDMNTGYTWDTDTPREWTLGITFKFTAGQTLQVDLGRRRNYANRATFLDLIGIPQVCALFLSYKLPLPANRCSNY